MRAKAKIPSATSTRSAITTLKTLVKWVSCLLTMRSFCANGRSGGAQYSRAAARRLSGRTGRREGGRRRARRGRRPRSVDRRVDHPQRDAEVGVLAPGGVDLLLAVAEAGGAVGHWQPRGRRAGR